MLIAQNFSRRAASVFGRTFVLKYFLELSNPPGKVPSHSCSTTTRCWSRYICRTICRATSSQISRSFCLGFSQKNRKRCGRAFVLKHSLELSDPPGKVPSHSCSTTTRCWGIYICRTICRATFSLILRPFCLYCLQTDLTRNYLRVCSTQVWVASIRDLCYGMTHEL